MKYKHQRQSRRCPMRLLIKVCCPPPPIRGVAVTPLQTGALSSQSILAYRSFSALFPPSNGTDNGDGTADLTTDDKGNAHEDHGMVRVDHSFSNTHSLFGRYIIDDSSSLVPYFGTPPGTYVPGFPIDHTARNQYFTVQDRSNFGREMFNELRFGVNRTTASTSIVNTHPGLSISLVPGRPFGMLDIAGMSLLGNGPETSVGDFSTVYQIQDQFSRTTGGHTLTFGGEFQRIQSNGPLDFGVDGLYTFQDLSPFGVPAQTNNPPLEFFLQALPLSYVWRWSLQLQFEPRLSPECSVRVHAGLLASDQPTHTECRATVRFLLESE